MSEAFKCHKQHRYETRKDLVLTGELFHLKLLLTDSCGRGEDVKINWRLRDGEDEIT